MRIMSWQELFGPLGGERKPKSKMRTLDKAQWQVLSEDVMFSGYVYAAGSKFKAFEGRDHGFVVFAPDTKTPTGHTPGKFIHSL